MGTSPNNAGTFQKSLLCPGVLGSGTAGPAAVVMKLKMLTIPEATQENKEVS